MKTTDLPIKSLLKNRVTLKKPTHSSLNDKWGEQDTTWTDYEIDALLSQEELSLYYIVEFGKTEVGDIIGLFLDSYTIETETVSVEVGDRIYDGDLHYRVDAIHKYNKFGLNVRIALLRRFE